MKLNRMWSLTALVLVAVFLRFIPHPPNFSPIGALALFAGVHFSKRWVAFAIPFVALFLSDLVLGFHVTMWAVYLSFALVVALGLLIRSNKTTKNIILSSLVGSLVFFLITNFAVWQTGMYGINFKGLVACYIAGLPFLENSVMGDLVYNGGLFSVWAFVESQFLFKSNPVGA